MKNSDQLSITATAFDQWREKRVYPPRTYPASSTTASRFAL